MGFLKNSLLLICVALILLCTSCKIYSFTGASIPPGAKTFSVGYFQNKALMVQPILSQTLTDKMKSYFSSNTNLEEVESYADFQITGEITGYVPNIPVAIQGDDKAALNRLTITIKVSVENKMDEKLNYQQSFSRYYDYDARLNFASIEVEILENICNELVEDVYMRTFANW